MLPPAGQANPHLSVGAGWVSDQHTIYVICGYDQHPWREEVSGLGAVCGAMGATAHAPSR
jgi:hypothetical protein